jgi:hypothetical protein
VGHETARRRQALTGPETTAGAGAQGGPANGGAPAYYAAGRGRLRDMRAVLHPPYTLWHLSYVVLGGLCGRHVDWGVLGATLLAFFLAVGVSAHALDELRGRPLRTELPAGVLVGAGVVGLAGAVALGAVGILRVGAPLAAFVVVGAVLVLAYNLELFGGVAHTGLVFALSWGAFPVLTAAYAENRTLPPAALAIAVFATLLSAAQRALSTPARTLRRRADAVDGEVRMSDGTVVLLDRPALLAPLESALRLLSFAVVAMAVGLVLLRLQIG